MSHAPSQVLNREHQPTVILTLAQARLVYLSSPNRLDLATLVRAFEGAPECVDVAGKMPKPCKRKRAKCP
jgi:hypothetical protein